MKKALATIMGLAFAVSAMAQYLIYDYNVSFKRLDAQFTKISYSYGKFDGKDKDFTGYFDSFTTASDKLVGQLVVPACKACNGNWEIFGSATYFTALEDNASAFQVAVNPDAVEDAAAFLAVYRNGDNLYKNPYLSYSSAYDVDNKLLWLLPAQVDGAMFGKGAGVRLEARDADDCSDAIKEDADYAGKPTSLKAAKEAWLVLTYDVPEFLTQDDDLLPPVKGLNPLDDCVAAHTVSYGFLGYLSRNGDVSNAGFGTVTTTTTKGSTTVGFCGTKVKDGASCIAFNSISGSTIGYFNYDGFCSLPALFDICTMLASRSAAPMAGTFTLKLNSAASKKATSMSAVYDWLVSKYGKYYWLDFISVN